MKTRLIIFVALVLAWLMVIGARLHQLQVTNFEVFAGRAASQHERFVEVDGPRGTIFDAAGRELAVSVGAATVVANPRKVEDPVAAAASIAEILALDAGELSVLEERLGSNRAFVYVARKVDADVAERLRQLHLEGLDFVLESRRYYPFRTLLSHVLGYAGMDNQGLAGLEFQYENVVAGKTARRMLLNDGRPGAVLADTSYAFTDPQPGRSLHLTVDASLQYLAEKELARAVAEAGAGAGIVILLDPRDSAILAMASYPTFDPNAFGSFTDEERHNRAVMDAFEPGSTFKMVTAAAVFENGLVDPEDLFFCEEGGIRLGRTYIRDHHPFGDLSFREVIAKSSNVGAIKAGQLVDDATFYALVDGFGFGHPTGVDLPGEHPGTVHPVERWWKLSKAYMSFGHEVAVNPLQLANAFAVVANGGWLHTPYIVRSIGTGEEEVVLPRAAPIQVLSPSTAMTLERVLEDVVTSGTATRAQVPGYRVAGKTGTAQKISDNGGYSDSLHLASFVGMVPARRPRLVGVVMIDEPQTATHGGVVAAPAFAAIARQALLYLGVPPDREMWAQQDTWMSPPSQELADLDAAHDDDLPVQVEAGS